MPEAFKGQADSDTVQNFIASLENWFSLTGLEQPVQRARVASILLQSKARTWFTTQAYGVETLRWSHLKSDPLRAFRPADFARVARTKLYAISQTSKDITGYIAAFNQALNRCSNMTNAEALYQFEQGLWAEVRLQVLNSGSTNLADAQAIAQRAGTVLAASQMYGYGSRHPGTMVTKKNHQSTGERSR